MVEHVNPEVVALMAISDPDVTSGDRAHIYACDSCRAQLEQLSHVVALARSTPLLDELSAPSAAVWDRIAAAVRATAVPTEDRAPRSSDHHVRPRSRNHRADRSRRRTVPVAVTSIVAAIALLVGIGGGIVVLDFHPRPPEAVVAATTLQALPNWPTARGEAMVENTSSGQRELVVNLSSVPASVGAFREVWIMSSSLKKLISLGVLVGDSGRFAMPADISMDAYPVVDVSEQPDNGNPAHSGNSIVRGSFS
jgi:hypothetical protein